MKTRRIKFGVKTALIAVACCAVFFAWLSSNIAVQKQEAEVLDQFVMQTGCGNSVSDSPEPDHHYGPFYSAYVDRAPVSLLGSLASRVWPNVFHRVIGIELDSACFGDETLDQLRTLSHLKRVTISDSRISKHALDQFAEECPKVTLAINDVYRYEDFVFPQDQNLAGWRQRESREGFKQFYDQIHKELQIVEGDISKLKDEIQTVVRISALLALNDEGKSLFANDFPDSPPYSVFVDDLKRLSANSSAERFAELVAKFDIVDLHFNREQRNKKMQFIDEDAGVIEQIWFPEDGLDMDQIREKLNDYILSNMSKLKVIQSE